MLCGFSFEDDDSLSIFFEFGGMLGLVVGLLWGGRLWDDFLGEIWWFRIRFLVVFFLFFIFFVFFVLFFLFFLFFSFDLLFKDLLFSIESEESFLLLLKHTKLMKISYWLISLITYCRIRNNLNYYCRFIWICSLYGSFLCI